ncbi:DNA polymerase III subunit epsilon [Sphingomonas sp. 1P06PA]|uniref:DNA polymerase III subunit epsilon n=1 Tax=Sphingomonas sp. 1P06PA TaxID=554121 RepID=UPI0039A55DF7
MREIVFDTETTGLSPDRGDRMVEIGCVELINRCETGREFHAYFNPGRPMPSEAEAIHGLSTTFLSDKPGFHERAADLIEFIGDAPLIAHNATFDFGFLNAELAACGRDPVCLSRMIDTVAMARARHPGAKHSLDALCTRYGIDRSHRIKHGALLDAQLLAQLYVELTGGRQIGFEMAVTMIPTGAGDVDHAPVVAQLRVRPPRPHAASPAELERHATFVGRLSDPLWARYGTVVDPTAAAA